jgi:hypothetical protein
MAFKMKGHTLPGINQRMDKSSLKDGRAKSSAFQKEGVKEKKLTPKEVEARKRRKENMKSIREANPGDWEKRTHGMPGESKGGTWTHKGTGKTMKDYYDTGETLPTVEVKRKTSPMTKKKKVDLNPAKIDYKNMTKAEVRAAVIAQNRKGPKTSVSMSHAMRMHRFYNK